MISPRGVQATSSFFPGTNSSRIVLYTLEYVYHIWEIGDLQNPAVRVSLDCKCSAAAASNPKLPLLETSIVCPYYHINARPSMHEGPRASLRSIPMPRMPDTIVRLPAGV